MSSFSKFVSKVRERILFWAAVGTSLGVSAEFVWSLSQFDPAEGLSYSRRRALVVAGIAFATAAVWEAWGVFAIQNRSRVVNVFHWSALLTWIRGSKPVTGAVPGIAISLYAAVTLLKLKDRPDRIGEIARFVNDKVFTFQFLGVRLEAVDIFRLELVGFITALLVLVVARACAPKSFVANYPDARAALAATIRKAGDTIPWRDLYLTLEDFRLETAKTVEWKEYDWSFVDDKLTEMRKQMAVKDPGTMETAASLVEKMPPAYTQLKELTDVLFENTRPVLRLVLVGGLLAAFVLSLLPILVRLVVVLFPFFEKGPSSWWM
ncbi:hypothetical protein XI09_14630 [Bradyrhizobium sp. CCBAU 11386]|uniref:hypothetical protein n=1 Tax=Bradyrhizobium sp. CCBAU 11386 TaxID=1630837 RepID=UPI00230472AF|nr:hypothetical protein [Bradyrhizobium sp. CCBAU 11386]MDA9505847.1 hypothetical protein [Bradyrhizobium sp. CCBAU 11386]